MIKKKFITHAILLIVISSSQLLAFLSRYYDLNNFWWNILSISIYFLFFGFWIISRKKNIWKNTLEAIISSSLVICISSVFTYSISYSILGGSLENIMYDNLGQMVHIFTMYYLTSSQALAWEFLTGAPAPNINLLQRIYTTILKRVAQFNNS